jgi:hypothetical protein
MRAILGWGAKVGAKLQLVKYDEKVQVKVWRLMGKMWCDFHGVFLNKLLIRTVHKITNC